MKRNFIKQCFIPLLSLGSLFGCNNNTTIPQEDAPTHDHIFSEVAHPDYMVEPATFTHGSKYKKSCWCGETNDETFTLDNTLSAPSIVRTQSERTITDMSAAFGDVVATFAFNKSAVYKRYSFEYDSLLIDGEKVRLSGAITIPYLNDEPVKRGIIVDNHATYTNNSESPSINWTLFSVTSITGSIVLEFDLVGYGSTSDMVLDYHCRHLQARNTVDGILAAFKLLDDEFGIDTNNLPIFNEGYSQGGYDSLSLLKYMSVEATEEEKAQIKLTKTFSGSGAYDVLLLLQEQIKSTKFDQPQYLILAIMSFYEYHRNDFGDITLQDLLTPYGMEFVEALKYKTDDAIDAVKNKKDASGNPMWTGASSIFKDSVLNMTEETLSIFKKICDEENLVDGSWYPTSPLYLFWSINDEMVAPACSQKAKSVFKATTKTGAFISYSTVTGAHTESATVFYINIATSILNFYKNSSL